MAATVPTKEPEKFTLGDTLKFTKSLPDYLPADGWVLSYEFVTSANAYSVTGSDNGDGLHLVTATAATTAAWVAGTYSYQAYVTSGSERFRVSVGTMEFLTNFAAGAYDARSHVKKVLEALEALLEGKASKDQANYAIGGRSLSRMSPELLIFWKNHYSMLYDKELAAERAARGLGSGNKVRVRFM